MNRTFNIVKGLIKNTFLILEINCNFRFYLEYEKNNHNFPFRNTISFL